MELFFDLAYVFAITQLTQTLLHSHDGEGAIKVAILFGAVWWVWNYTAWTTAWADPDTLPVRLYLAGSMLLCIVMSAAIPEAFGGRGWQFAAAVAVLQVGRPVGMMVLLEHQPSLRRNYLHVLIFSGGAACVWLAGAAVEDETRLLVWGIALLIDVSGPALHYRLPFMGERPMSSWPMEPSHLGERCRLILLIALGETVLNTGHAFAEIPTTRTSLAALVVAFATVACLWWLYFARHADEAVARLSRSSSPASQGAGGFNYAHAVLIGALVVIAVGIDLTMSHPHQGVDISTALVISGGAAMYGIGISLFTAQTGGLDATEKVMASAMVLVLGVLVLLGTVLALSALSQSLLTTVVLLSVVGAAAVHARRIDR